MEDYTCEGCACDCGSCDEKQTIKVLSVVIASLIAIVIAFGIGFSVGVMK
jgi:hypothetical protein